MGWVISLWEFMCLRKFLYRLPDCSPFRFLLMTRGELVTGPSPSSSEEKLFPWWLYVCVLFAVVSADCLVVCFVLAIDFVVIEGSVVAEEVATVVKATGERVDSRSLLCRKLLDALAPALVFGG